MWRKNIILLLTCVTNCMFVYSGEIYKGTCGENLTWELNISKKTLTIKGTGAMTDYGDGEHAPWYDSYYRDNIYNLTIQDGITHIGDKAFEQCSFISKVTIPNSVTSIGDKVFNGCVSVATLTLSENLITIGKSAFRSCNRFKNLIIPNSVTLIDNYAFYMCDALESVYFGNSVDTIGTRSFYGCGSLKTIDFGASSHYIGGSAFANCPLIESVIFPSGVNIIGNDAFRNCTKLSQIVFGNGLKRIGTGAFYGCISIKSIIIPDNIEGIGMDAFRACDSLYSVTIGQGLKEIASYAFKQCYAISEVHISDIEAWCNIHFNDTTSNPIYYAHKLYVGNELVTKVRTTGKASVIKHYAFYGCLGLDSIFIDSVEYIGNCAFYNCDSIKYVSIRDNVQKISYSAFKGCSHLSTLEIGNNVTKIELEAFRDCINLQSITLGGNLADIGKSAFSNCANISSVVIPAGVEKIGECAFANCSNLSTVRCMGHTPASLEYTSSAGKITYNNFIGTAEDFTIFVPCGTLDEYITSWDYYSNNIKYEPAPFSIQLEADETQGKVRLDKEMESVCDTIVTMTAIPNVGYHFLQWHDSVSTNPRTIVLKQDTAFTAQFTKNHYLVQFFGFNDVLLDSQSVEHGTAATAPEAPKVDYYDFVGWDKEFSNITSNLDVFAIYQQKTEGIADVNMDILPQKVVIDGHIYILRADHIFDTQGKMIK